MPPRATLLVLCCNLHVLSILLRLLPRVYSRRTGGTPTTRPRLPRLPREPRPSRRIPRRRRRIGGRRRSGPSRTEKARPRRRRRRRRVDEGETAERDAATRAPAAGPDRAPFSFCQPTADFASSLNLNRRCVIRVGLVSTVSDPWGGCSNLDGSRALPVPFFPGPKTSIFAKRRFRPVYDSRKVKISLPKNISGRKFLRLRLRTARNSH